MEISVPAEIVKLNDSQKKILYEFAVLQKNSTDANAYWLKNKNQFPAFDDNVRDKLVNEVFVNSQLLYTPAKDSSIQLWAQSQSLTTWMLYLAAFIAICAIMGLMRNYWSLLIDVIIKRFVPIFRLLFSPVLLTYELLIGGIFCIYGGCLIEDFFIRTVVIHIGIFLVWSQVTAIITKEYLVKKYIFEIKDNYWKNDKWQVLITICFPALVVTALLLYVLYKIPEDVIYNYEIVLSSLCTIYALPFWRHVEKYIYPVLIPFKDDKVERAFDSLATCTVLALIGDGVFIYLQNPLFSYIIIALTTLLIISLAILSLKENYKNNYKNYYYLNLVTIAFFVCILMYSFSARIGELIWVSLIGVSVFIIIKYWEILTFFFNWKSKNRLTWGFLGMAVLLWILAKSILYISRELYVI
ncbi:MAG: hypothetical protein EOO44_03365 [Flavobacterium sp.]|nr:MAG: hypothetical protein EOO44_03365 [Flavobacterium sp.]